MENPKIRFKGFTKDWEQRKVGELLEERNEQAPMSEDYPLMAFIANQGVTQKGERYDRSALVNDETGKKYKRTEFGDFIYSSNNLETGSIGLNKYGNACISPVYSIFKSTGKAELDFLGRRFLRKDFINEMVKWRQGVVYGQWKIHETDFMKIEVRIPSVDEQKKIGLYFDSLDNLITLHQRKCEQTKKLKKYMLQKMFPQNGEKVPEIRFDGFTYDWEQRKLGDDLVSIHTGTNLLGSITNTGMPLIKMGNIQRGYFDTSKVEFLAENEQPDKADIANYGDFFFNTRNTLELVGKGATWMKNSGEYAFNSNIARFELRNLDTIFFNYLYNTDYMTKQIHARAMGTTSVAAIYPRTLDSVEYLAPCMKEQQKIGAYFKQLDHLITLHQRKCDELKKMKKYMLQNMFI